MAQQPNKAPPTTPEVIDLEAVDPAKVMSPDLNPAPGASTNATVLSQFDLDGDGVVSPDEMAVAAENMRHNKKTVRYLARAIAGLTALFLVLCAMVIGAGIIANEVTKEVKTEDGSADGAPSEVSTLTAASGKPVATVSTYQMVNHTSLEYLLDAPLKVLEETTHISHTVDGDTFNFDVLGFTQLRSQDTTHLFLSHNLVLTIKRAAEPVLHKHNEDMLDEYLGHAFSSEQHTTFKSKYVPLQTVTGSFETTTTGGDTTGVNSFGPITSITSIQIAAGQIVDAIIINGNSYGGSGGDKTQTRYISSMEEIERISVWKGSGYWAPTIAGIKIEFKNQADLQAGTTDGSPTYQSPGDRLLQSLSGTYDQFLNSLTVQVGECSIAPYDAGSPTSQAYRDEMAARNTCGDWVVSGHQGPSQHYEHWNAEKKGRKILLDRYCPETWLKHFAYSAKLAADHANGAVKPAGFSWEDKGNADDFMESGNPNQGGWVKPLHGSGECVNLNSYSNATSSAWIADGWQCEFFSWRDCGGGSLSMPNIYPTEDYTVSPWGNVKHAGRDMNDEIQSFQCELSQPGGFATEQANSPMECLGRFWLPPSTMA